MAKLHGVKTLDMVNGKKTKVLYDGVEYVRVGGEGQPGDIGLRISNPTTYVSLGHFYPIIYDRGLMYIDDDGDLMGVPPGTFSFFRKVSASQPSLEDRVNTNEKDIESLKSDVAALKGEAKPEYVRIDKSEAKAGDFVKFDEAPNEYLTAGEYYEIYRVDGCGDPQIRDDYGDGFDTCDADDFEVYRKVSAAEPKPERLKVGDYAKVVVKISGHLACEGDVVVIKEDDKDFQPFLCEDLNGGRLGYFYERELVRATDEEVAEAKRKQAEEGERKRWAAIGRKVGEYKAGDVFRNPSGDLFEIKQIDESSSFPIVFIRPTGCEDGYKYDAAIELVTPVEARFDRKGDE
ncbi:hypothetical protein MOC74_21990 [Bacillus haynesii]|uniref:hypothetical protein n=1 Tax=Bacillus haynesii TaxID=1925021 RepID=UPI00227F6289|nr:hypothetical protein [Bacillus haynesii]MCY8348079.1 hypothetical protein [Bacillus haynesii]